MSPVFTVVSFELRIDICEICFLIKTAIIKNDGLEVFDNVGIEDCKVLNFTLLSWNAFWNYFIDFLNKKHKQWINLEQ